MTLTYHEELPRWESQPASTSLKESPFLTAQHFGISRKTFYKWSRRFRDSKYNVDSLADRSRAPHRKRHWEVTLIREERIRRLRKRYLYYGKRKLKVIVSSFSLILLLSTGIMLKSMNGSTTIAAKLQFKELFIFTFFVALPQIFRP